MDAHIYKKLELTGTSTTSMEDAARNAIRKTSASVHHLRWFEVTELRGDIADGDIAHWQVTLKVGFRIEEPDE